MKLPTPLRPFQITVVAEQAGAGSRIGTAQQQLDLCRPALLLNRA